MNEGYIPGLQSQNQQDTSSQGYIPGQNNETTHVVNPGETLSGISQQAGVPMSNITGYKSGDPNKIQAGETLHITKAFQQGDSSPEISAKGAVLAGADPTDIAWAKKQLGSSDFNGYCMSFVAQATGHSTPGNAINNWYQSNNKVEGTLNGIKPGDVIYWSPNSSNDNLGHVGIYEGGNKFISATDMGVKEFDFDNWMKMTNQSILGYVPEGGQNAANR